MAIGEKEFETRAALPQPFAPSFPLFPWLPAPHSPEDRHLILLVGLPASGKSTLAKQLVNDCPERLLISTDAVREKLFGDEVIQGPWLQIQLEIKQQFHQAVRQISQGAAQEAIYDATNAVRRQRRRLITLARTTGFTHLTGLWLDIPLELCLERNRRRDRQVPEVIIDQMHHRLMGAPPSLEEGLNCLIRLVPKG